MMQLNEPLRKVKKMWQTLFEFKKPKTDNTIRPRPALELRPLDPEPNALTVDSHWIAQLCVFAADW